MQAPREDLALPKNDKFTLAQLKDFDDSDPSKPIYVSLKGTLFDVATKADIYVVMFRARPRPASRAEPGPGLIKPGQACHRALAGPGLGLEECQACQARQARA
ncbi:hypothetical protein B0H19DRAFT_1080226 [Mycena capillaripes]|nr:hypothetical protein B0H19DRAFT_1080226 [Mycena capillaripes]